MLTKERDKLEQELSDDAEELLKKYMKVFLYNQLWTERGRKIPGDLTFVFGHTHKPFRKHYKGNDFKVKDDDFDTYYPNGVKVYNTGGWIVESIGKERKKKRGGAILLLDDNLNTTFVEMYKEKDKWQEYRVEVVREVSKNDDAKEFNDHIADLVGDVTKGTWGSFSRNTSDAVDIRAHYLKKRQENEL